MIFVFFFKKTYSFLLIFHKYFLHGYKFFVTIFFPSLEYLTVNVCLLVQPQYFVYKAQFTYPNVPWPILATFSYLFDSSQKKKS